MHGLCFPVVSVRTGRPGRVPARATLEANISEATVDPGASGPSATGARSTPTGRCIDATDTVNAWGVVRDRDTGKVPATVKFRLLRAGGDRGGKEGAPLRRPRPTRTRSGHSPTSLALDDVPEGDYVVESSVAGDIVGSALVPGRPHPEARISARGRDRPAGLLPGRPDQGDGQQRRSTKGPGPGCPAAAGRLRRADIHDRRGGRPRTTGRRSASTATTRTTATEPDVRSVFVTPARAEEGVDLRRQSRDHRVQRAHGSFDATTTGGRRARPGHRQPSCGRSRSPRARDHEREASVWELDPTVDADRRQDRSSATFTEQIPYRTRTGTRYDFIEKKVVPVYEYGLERARRHGSGHDRSDGIVHGLDQGLRARPHL